MALSRKQYKPAQDVIINDAISEGHRTRIGLINSFLFNPLRPFLPGKEIMVQGVFPATGEEQQYKSGEVQQGKFLTSKAIVSMNHQSNDRHSNDQGDHSQTGS